MLKPPISPNPDETSYRLTGDFASHSLSKSLVSAFFSSLGLNHKLPTETLAMEGMSGRKYRYLINNLIGSIHNPCYLEVGSWLGSTACSAIYQNSVKITCIDNWSQFGGPKDKFIENISRHLGPNVDFQYIESDFRKVDFSKLGSLYNVYLFDGPHEESDQYDGITIAQPALSDTYILIVDDWNWPDVRNGTLKALSDINSKILCSIVILTNQNNTFPQVAFKDSEWHNGYFLAVIQK